MRFCSSCGTASSDSTRRLHSHDALPRFSESSKPEWDSSPAPGYASTGPVGVGLSLFSTTLEQNDRDGSRHDDTELNTYRRHFGWRAINPNDVVQTPGQARGSQSPIEPEEPKCRTPDDMETRRSYCVWRHWMNSARLREERERKERHRLNLIHERDAMDAQHSRAEHLEEPFFL